MRQKNDCDTRVLMKAETRQDKPKTSERQTATKANTRQNKTKGQRQSQKTRQDKGQEITKTRPGTTRQDSTITKDNRRHTRLDNCQDKTRQDETRQDESRRDETETETRRDETRRDKTRQDITRQDKTKTRLIDKAIVSFSFCSLCLVLPSFVTYVP